MKTLVFDFSSRCNRTLVTISVCLAMALLLSGCGKDESNPVVTPEPNIPPAKTKDVVVEVRVSDSSGLGLSRWELVVGYQWRGPAYPGESQSVKTDVIGRASAYLHYQHPSTVVGIAVSLKTTPTGVDWNDPHFPWTYTWSPEHNYNPGSRVIFRLTIEPTNLVWSIVVEDL